MKYQRYFDKVAQVKVITAFTTSTLENLQPYTDYTIQLIPFNGGGDGPAEFAVEKTLEGGTFIVFYDNIFLKIIFFEAHIIEKLKTLSNLHNLKGGMMRTFLGQKGAATS